MEQLAVSNNKRFGRSSEKMEPDNQIAFMEADGEFIYFNEAEVVVAITEYDENEPDDKDMSFLENLLPWSEQLPDHCWKKNEHS